MDRARRLLAFDPRDKVFAILTLLKYMDISLPPPDYSKSVSDIYIETAVAFLGCNGNMEIGNMTGLPSWVPDLSAREHPKLPWFGEGSSVSVPAFQFLNHNRVLQLKGVAVGTVASVSGPSILFEPQDLCHPQEHTEWMQKEGSSTMVFQDLLKASPAHAQLIYDVRHCGVLRNLVAFATTYATSRETARPTCLPPQQPRHKTRLLADSLWHKWLLIITSNSQPPKVVGEETKLSGRWSITTIQDTPSMLPLVDMPELMALWMATQDADILEYHENIRKIRMFKTLFRTAAGRLGIAPRSVRTGDMIVSIAGSTLPMLLRSDGENCRLICPAFVNGMEGEKWPADADAQLQWFMLV
ncbi:uncharacterized protein BDZ99DRAFT_492698 [Mytilinidion resinicola]|uniref:Uncharacterized protein n=1 Tax=Mytilinidion resinicola TaxID=574789 RepID=A0A6A6Z7D2_9PEZI|nr:uncharacterized protein BDZ99DRAFT_492698 [Mytilinidion resinicola]KAF2816728.1 hypothetical protein BDZ99DRAFT_492698 [Mytilinidion resinicola]